MGEAKRLTPEVRAARAAAVHAEAVDVSKDRQRRAVDALVHAVRHHMHGMPPDQMTVVLGTAVGIFAASVPGTARAFATRVDEVTRDVIAQAQEAVS